MKDRVEPNHHVITLIKPKAHGMDIRCEMIGNIVKIIWTKNQLNKVQRIVFQRTKYDLAFIEIDENIFAVDDVVKDIGIGKTGNNLYKEKG